MSTTMQLACGAVATALALAVLALQVARWRARRRSPSRTLADWSLVLSRAPGHQVQCIVPTCGHPVDVMRGRFGGHVVALEPCGHVVNREALRQAVGP